MVEADLDEVIEIERASFSEPWTRELMARELDNPVSFQFVKKIDTKCPRRIAGFIVIWIVCGDAHILDLAVKEELRRGGIAKALVEFALDFMRQKGVVVVSLEVRRSNEAAMELYKSFGFSRAYVRNKYYGDEDAVVMSLTLQDDNNEDK